MGAIYVPGTVLITVDRVVIKMKSLIPQSSQSGGETASNKQTNIYSTKIPGGKKCFEEK